MQERILTGIPNPEKAVKGNEILSYWEPVATKVGGTWKKYVGVPYALSARTENVLPYLDLFQNQLTKTRPEDMNHQLEKVHDLFDPAWPEGAALSLRLCQSYFLISALHCVKCCFN